LTTDDLIVAALRHHEATWPGDAGEELASSVLASAEDHGVMPLLSTTPAVERWPVHVREALRTARRSEAALEVLRRRELGALLREFRAARIPVLLLKGAQIAYTHYPTPCLRPRLDTDLLVAARDRPRTDGLLRARGYVPQTGFDGTLVTHQFQYERRNQFGLRDVIDLHWKVANPQMFAGVFAFEELECDATPVASLDADARGLSNPHALLFACMHRVAHHDNSDRLIWLYDIHLLASSMSAGDRDKAVDLAAAKQIRSLCGRGIARAQATFGTTLPTGWLEQMQVERSSEPTAVYLSNGRRRVDTLVDDLRTLPGWRPRLRLLREHLFPPPAYMRRIYGSWNPFFLPLAYVDRVVTGMGKWFRRTG